ncbi:MAG: Hpt domain-containing protein [Terracidiphilus sp.]
MDPDAQTSSAGGAALGDALDRLWTRFLPEIEQRVAMLKSSAAAAAVGSLTQAQWEAAHSAAHKLAGVLGTFGLAEGTTLARELEDAYAHDAGIDAACGKRLAALAERLRAIVESRKKS